MAKLDCSIEGPIGEALRAHARELSALLQGDIVNLTEIGKVYGRIASTLLEAIEQAGLSSMRFRVAAKALDLKTPKSRLEAFLADGRP